MVHGCVSRFARRHGCRAPIHLVHGWLAMPSSPSPMPPKSQPSRKGRKAWRKNVDVSDVSEALAAKREREVLVGDDGDFIIDNDGDLSRATKKSKVAEILSNKSKIPALEARKLKKQVSVKEAKRLLVLAGRLKTGNAFQERLELDGVLRASNQDIWGSEETKKEVPASLLRDLAHSVVPRPQTLDEKPVPLVLEEKRDSLVDAGKSYNPSLESWKLLIDKEFNIEYSHETKRQAMQEQAEHIQHLIETLPDENDMSAFGEENEEEEEVANEDVDEENKYRLSVNKPNVVKIKTRTQRNRQLRHKEELALHKKLRDLKQQIKDLQRLEEIEKEVDVKAAEPVKKKARVIKRHGNVELQFKPLEIKLADELTGSLRTMKPEGNLLLDQMHKLQANGMVAGFSKAPRKRKLKTKYVEKHSYRHWKR